MNRHFILYLLVVITFSCTKSTPYIGTAKDVKETGIYWRLIGPGDADQVTAINISGEGIVYVSTDIGGVYKSDDSVGMWAPINRGIKNYDVQTPVIISPDDENILFIGTRGGVFKSVNGGKTWKAKWNGIARGKPADATISACVGSISLDPLNPKTIYMGIGYRPNSEGSSFVRRLKWKGDIYRSTDRGETWKIIASLGKNVMIRHIHLITSELIYASTSSGLFKSSDAGRTWNNILPVSTKYIVAFPQKPDILYIAAGEKGIYKSLNAGREWAKINKGLSLRAGNATHGDNYTQIVLDNSRQNTIYAINTTWGQGGGVYESTNSGDSWKKVTVWPDGINRLFQRNINVESAWLKHSRRVNAIAIDPQNSNRLFIGTSRYIYKTEDRGKSWQQLISRKVSDDTWVHRGMNIFGHSRVVGTDPVDINRLYIGTADHGLVKSEDGGKSWKQSTNGMVYKDNIYDIAVNPADNSIVYAINGKGGFKKAGVAKSYDYGESWKQLINGLEVTMYYTLLINTENPDMLYVGGIGKLYVTVDGGKSWMARNKGLEGVTVHKLVFHPQTKETIFAATSKGLYKTVDSGNSWHRTHFTEMNFYAVAIDRNQESTIYVGAVQDGRRKVLGGVFKSQDGGKHWRRVLDARRIESVSVLPFQPSIIYALSNDFQYHDESSGEGVFRSDDGGDTWERVNKGLAVHRGFNLNIAPYPPYKIYLSTQGSGAYVATDPAAAVPLQ